MSEVPSAVQRMIDATNAGDSEAFVAAFTPDAVLVDWGKEFEGREGIASWNESDNIGRSAHFEIVESVAEGDVWIVNLAVTGGGFNGESGFRFELTDDLISRMEIQP
jgi:ketosteroid isomerase-like protein